MNEIRSPVRLQPHSAQFQDAVLVAGAVRGDVESIEQIWERYASLVGRILGRVFGSSPDSVDLSQDVFVCVFQQMTKLRQPEALRSYIVGICLRVARNHLRRKKVRAIVGLAENVDLLPSPAVADPDTRDAVRRLCELLDGLTVEDRSLFVSRYVEGMRIEEIATLHAMTFPTARRRIDRMTKRVSIRANRDEVLSTYFEGFPFARRAGLRPAHASM
jgi:RNA polymerase sigma-70 factor, ECF subfamily